jgi:hypothetical protein
MAQQTRKMGADGQPEEESFFAKYVIFHQVSEMANHHWYRLVVSFKRSRWEARSRCSSTMILKNVVF